MRIFEGRLLVHLGGMEDFQMMVILGSTCQGEKHIVCTDISNKYKFCLGDQSVMWLIAEYRKCDHGRPMVRRFNIRVPTRMRNEQFDHGVGEKVVLRKPGCDEDI